MNRNIDGEGAQWYFYGGLWLRRRCLVLPIRRNASAERIAEISPLNMRPRRGLTTKFTAERMNRLSRWYGINMPIDRRPGAWRARRVAVLESAVTVLAERGYENTRYTDVSISSGVAVSTLQKYFGSRQGMLIETVRYATDVELLAMDALADAVADPWNRLVALIDRNLNTPTHNHRLIMEVWRAGIRDAELRGYAHEHWASYRLPFLKTVVKGCDQGVFSPTINPGDVVDQLLAMLTGRMVPHVLQFPVPTADRFRNAVLRQTAHTLGRTVRH